MKRPGMLISLTDKDGVLIRLHDTYYGADGKAWHLCASNEKYVYGYLATIPEPPVSEFGQMLKRLKPEWLSRYEPDSWDKWEDDFSRWVFDDEIIHHAYSLLERSRELRNG